MIKVVHHIGFWHFVVCTDVGTLNLPGKDIQTTSSWTRWLCATIEVEIPAENVALKEEMTAHKKVRDTIHLFSFPFVLLLLNSSSQFLLFLSPWQLRNFAGLCSWACLAVLENFGFFLRCTFPEILLNPLISIVWWQASKFWQCGSSRERMSSCEGKVKWSSDGWGTGVWYCLLCAYMRNPNTWMHIRTASLLLIIIGTCSIVGFHPSAHAFLEKRWQKSMWDDSPMQSRSESQNHTRNTKEL